MMIPTEICRDEQRRHRVLEHRDAQGQHDSNGIDYIEVSDDQLTLTVFFLREAPPFKPSDKGSGNRPDTVEPEDVLTPANVRIEGGRRVSGIKVTKIAACRQSNLVVKDCLEMTLDKYGDFSTYTLHLVSLDEHGQSTGQPFPGFDRRYSQVQFSFKANCPSDLDCLSANSCPPQILAEPEINYLAKDYASFRQLILDRLALLMPDWKERHVPDVGIVLVEILAYVGDHLSYYQDAVATEAYLETARRRVSVRRHARLVDYPMHEGCNARAWVAIETSEEDLPLEPEQISFITGHKEATGINGTVLTVEDLRSVHPDQYEVFEPMMPRTIYLHKAHNTIRFYTWGDRECCLPRGATRATLLDEYLTPPTPGQNDTPKQQSAPQQQNTEEDYGTTSKSVEKRKRKLDELKAGDVLIFEEVKGPRTGRKADADPAHCHAVRLTQVIREEEVGSEKRDLVDSLYDQPIVEIEWAREDQLPFPLCLSTISQAPDCQYVDDVSVARGNVVLADHGRTIGRIWPDEEAPEELGQVPLKATRATCGDNGCPPEIETVPGRFYPRLKQGPLTFGEPLPTAMAQVAATSLMNQQLQRAEAQITLQSVLPAGRTDWQARRDLLGSQLEDAHFVVEMDNEGRAHLRFGNGDLGRAPSAGSSFTAVYRVGNGPAGNVGREAIAYAVLDVRRGITGVRNPLPAVGGTVPEPLSQVKMFAPHAFRSELQRAVTADDYARLAERENPSVQRAAATLRWTGSWYEVLVTIDPRGEEEAGDDLLHAVEQSLQPYRRIGHDIVVAKAIYVPLDIALTVCIGRGYLRGQVEAALRDLFSTRTLPDGTQGFFHPDRLSFGDDITLSRLVALAQSVPGVENVAVTRMQRLGKGSRNELKHGFLTLEPLEIARLDNDPSFPENGWLKLDMRGER